MPLIGQAARQQVCVPPCEWLLHHRVTVTWAAALLVPVYIDAAAAAAAGISIAVCVKTLTPPDSHTLLSLKRFRFPLQIASPLWIHESFYK